MLAVPGEPFDSPEHLFEVKWDGIRALTSVEPGYLRIWGRQATEYTRRYPELDCLNRLPSGTVLDGELVVLRSGLPTLGAIMSRHQLVTERMIRHASQLCPVTYVVFDLISYKGDSLLMHPLRARRELLERLVEQMTEPRLLLSRGVAGPGRALFSTAVSLGHEGIMAKHLMSSYVPNRRSSAWLKIKPRRSVPHAATVGDYALPALGDSRRHARLKSSAFHDETTTT
jgi:ATP-dependent DNA ligase